MGARVSFALRTLVMLAAVMPLFAATAFRPLWWQTLLAAMLGSVLGQVALRATRGRRAAAWSVAGAAAIIAALAGAWSLRHAAGHDDSSGNAFTYTARHDDSSANGFLVVRSRDSGNLSLTWDDVRAIETQIPSIHLTAPYLHQAVQLINAELNWKTDLVGTTPDYFNIRALRVAAGDRFNASESGKVVVLGETVVAQLYGAAKTPIGEVVRINNMPFTIIGVLAHQGMSPQGQDLDDVALVPIDVYLSKIAFDSKLQFRGAVIVSATSRGDTARIEAELHSLLRDRHHLAPGDDDDFIIRNSNPE
jgi:putative ABC transport system permease protein